jgi:hypothetical protein
MIQAIPEPKIPENGPEPDSDWNFSGILNLGLSINIRLWRLCFMRRSFVQQITNT